MLELVSIVNFTMAKAGLGGDNGLAITGGAKIMVGSCSGLAMTGGATGGRKILIFGSECSFIGAESDICMLDVGAMYS